MWCALKMPPMPFAVYPNPNTGNNYLLFLAHILC